MNDHRISHLDYISGKSYLDEFFLFSFCYFSLWCQISGEIQTSWIHFWKNLVNWRAKEVILVYSQCWEMIATSTLKQDTTKVVDVKLMIISSIICIYADWNFIGLQSKNIGENFTSTKLLVYQCKKSCFWERKEKIETIPYY